MDEPDKPGRVLHFRAESAHARWGQDREVDRDSKGDWRCGCGWIGRPILVHDYDDRFRLDDIYRECPKCHNPEPGPIQLPIGARGCDGCHMALAEPGSDYCHTCSEDDE
mgnify:FL=1